ncbi:sensor histidine kinase [Paludifilum halophilum]|uniref:sensor histidine kinase n=1 Tax=Paludifilum halophilum TaxID=1642702 RepID=UPI00114022B2|nr:histidine kinase N-terminal domain-containing protein [Paludifilum halophilum]
MTSIEELCKEHTSLMDEDIRQICDLSRKLRMIADLSQAHVFIDCPVKNGPHAVVVAEASPSTGSSLYRKSVVGQWAYEMYEPAVARTHQTGEPTVRNRAITQEGKTVKQSVVPVKNDRGEIIGSLIMEQDISLQLRHENQLRALSHTTEQLSQTLMGMAEQGSLIPDLIQEALFLVDREGRIDYANTQALNLLAGGESQDIPVDDQLEFLRDLDYQSHEVHYEEVRWRKKTLGVKSISLRKENRRIGTLLMIRDVTELREKERQLMVKSTVIKEIHHRVKNNLQMIASLLRLQMRRAPSKEVKSIFQESLNRILSIASVHEIFSSTGLDEVEILDMMKKIGSMLVVNGRPDKEIEIAFTGKPIILPSDKAVSLALVVNELIQNSVEHAFVDRKYGRIGVHIESLGYEVRVRIWDDGYGLPSKRNEEASLGLQIVRTLAEQDLSGSFSAFPTPEGTEAIVQFPLEEG